MEEGEERERKRSKREKGEIRKGCGCRSKRKNRKGIDVRRRERGTKRGSGNEEK